MNVLIVDDNVDFCTTIADIVQSFGHETITINDPVEALRYMERPNRNIGIILLDIEFGPAATLNGLEVLEHCRMRFPAVPVVMISGKGTIETAVRATKLGAINFIEKSVLSKDRLKEVLDSAVSRLGAQGEAKEIIKFLNMQGIHGKSKGIIEVGDSAIRFGRTDLNVMISGETGTGKKLVAKAIHAVSRRSKYPFVTVDIPNIPRELFQSELFGHNKGSFSGATDTKKGLFHKAQKGTLFLDEIGDLSLELQSNLFIPIEEKLVRRVGSVETEDVDIRFVSATDRDLIHAMKESKFREQLYHRLRECEIYLPPLRERTEDIPYIAEYYIQKHNEEFDDNKFLSPSSIEFLQEQLWPGNIREMASVIRVVLQTVSKEEIEIADLHKYVAINGNVQLPEILLEASISSRRTLKEDLALTDKVKIETTLDTCNGNVSRSAAMLGISRETLHNKIRRYDINIHNFRHKRPKA
jgi:two-component system, NtrC family, nitrogen regulation response regulator NtrX